MPGVDIDRPDTVIDFLAPGFIGGRLIVFSGISPHPEKLLSRHIPKEDAGDVVDPLFLIVTIALKDFP